MHRHLGLMATAAFCGSMGLLIAPMARTVAGEPLAYVANQGNGTVSVIDTIRDEVVRTVPSQGSLGKKIQAVVGERTGKTLFVVDAAANALIVVDAVSGRVIRSLDVGRAPEGASMSPSGKTLAVCVEDDNAVALVDVATVAIARKIRTQGKNPEHCVFNGDEEWLMASDENSDEVDIIDLKAGRSVALVHTSGGPRGIAWLPNQLIAYVAQERGGGVDVIDVAKRAIVRSIHTGLRPADVIIGKDGKFAFVSNGGDATVSVIDTASATVVATMAVGKRPWNMALTANGKKLYVANGRSNSVSVIDTQALRVLKSIGVGELPWGVEIPNSPFVH
jgi:YVTN family beta-propeller protein